jgi:transcriptional regulator with XRE-family HTH domain
LANDQKLPDIRADVIKKAREAKGISIPQISKDLCFSVKQIEQIESGERSHFYSLAIKVSAAKRVAEYLGLPFEEVFDFGPDLLEAIQAPDEQIAPEKNTLPESKSTPVIAPATPEPAVVEKIPERLERFDPPTEEKEVKPSKTKYAFFALAAIVVAIVLNIELPAKDKNAEPIVAKLPTESIENTANSSAKKEDAPLSPTAVSSPSPTPVAVVPAVAAVAPSTSSENCPALDANQTTYRSPSPSKAGNMIYISTKIKQVVCVKDATGKLEKKSLDVNGSHSFFGKAPFVLMTSGLAQADIFFQGYKVRVEDQNAKSITLEEVPF